MVEKLSAGCCSCCPNRLEGITTDVNNSSVCGWWARQGGQAPNVKGVFWVKAFPYDFCKNNTEVNNLF